MKENPEPTLSDALPSHSLVPHQKTGTRTAASSKVEKTTRHDAIVLFQEARQRLLDINHWAALCGNNTTFELTDATGKPLQSATPKVGDLIRIRLPAPANASGDGYDWVRIEAFENTRDLVKDMDTFGFRVRPFPNPQEHTPERAHFYTGAATSTFLVIRKASTVWAVERGRNEHVNASAGSFWNKLRNLGIALAAKMGFSYPQWKRLVTGILKGPPTKH